MNNVIQKIFFILLVVFTISVNAQDTVFMHTYGLPGYNYGTKTLQTSDGGFIVSGNKSGFIGNTDIYLVRTNYKGDIIWDKAIGGSDIEWASDIQITSDKGFIITGYTNNAPNNDYNVLVIRTDSLGNIKWSNIYGGNEWDFGKSIVQLADSSFIIAGETFSNSHGNNDILMMGIGKNGDSLWSKTYGASQSEAAYSLGVQSGFCYISGYTNSFGAGKFDAFLLKTSLNGDSLLMKTYGDTADDKGYGFIFTEDNGILLCGSTRNFGALALDGIIFKTDLNGNLLWKNVFGGPESDDFYSVCQNDKKEYLLLGNTESFGFAGTNDLYLIIADKDGNFSTGFTYGLDKFDNGKQISLTSDKGCVITGSTESMGIGISNIFVIKTDSTYQLDMSNWTPIAGVKDSEELQNQLMVFPNPASNYCSISFTTKATQDVILKLCDISGRIVFEKNLTCTGNSNTFQLDLSDLQSGLYNLNINGPGIYYNKKIICIK